MCKEQAGEGHDSSLSHPWTPGAALSQQPFLRWSPSPEAFDGDSAERDRLRHHLPLGWPVSWNLPSGPAGSLLCLWESRVLASSQDPTPRPLRVSGAPGRGAVPRDPPPPRPRALGPHHFGFSELSSQISSKAYFAKEKRSIGFRFGRRFREQSPL